MRARFPSAPRAAGFALLLAAGAAPAAAQILIDLATLPERPALERLAERRSHYVTLAHLLPGAAYRLSFGPRHASAELLSADTAALERVRLAASRGSSCPELGAVLDAADEAAVAHALAALASSSACGGWERGELTRLARRQVATPVRLDADEQDEPLRVVVERLAANGETARRWTLEYAPPPVETRWASASETEWLVLQVSLDLLEMAAFADGRRAFDATSAGLRLAAVAAAGAGVAIDLAASWRRAPLGVRIVLADHVWSAADYEPLARSLQRGLARQQPAASGAAGTGAFAALLDLRSTVLERESQRVSRLLEGDLLDASGHEAAALVLAGLALRESAGYFADSRLLLCRMTAHLAWARALRDGGSASVDGRLAQAALLSLVGRQRDAMGELQRLEAEAPANPALLSWLHALRLRATSDFRTLKDPGSASLLERLEYFRALAASLDVDHAQDFARSHGREPVPDWSRRALARGVSVETGNVFTASAVALELADLAETWQAARGTTLADVDAALLASPARCITRREDGTLGPRVIGWGAWAGSFERHLMQALDRTDDHVRGRLAIPSRADAIAKDFDARFARLPLYSFVRLRREARIREREEAKTGKAVSGSPPECPRAVRLLREEPERVAPLNWLLARGRCRGGAETATVPRARLWFTTGVPPGTAFEAVRRLGVSASLVRPQLDALAVRAPYDFELARQALEARAGKEPSPQALDAAYGALLEYHLGALWDRAQASEGDVAEYRRFAERILALDADSGLAVGEYLARQGLGEAAASAYETAVRGGRDRVAVANRCAWLVEYYLDHGHEPDALRLAQEAADTFSARGIVTLARLLEQLGRYPEALAWLEKEAERYDDPREVEEYRLRRERRAPGEGPLAAARAALLRHFPQGLERVDLGDFLLEPKRGVEIRESSRALASLGLDKGDVIVALDGYRTASYQQYRIVRDMTDDPEVRLIAWHGDRYVEARGSFPRRRFDALLGDYEAKPVH
jgi:tetratricopeptide (TPR) repeat protein